MKKIRATVIGLATLVFASVLSFLPSRSVAAASINLDSYVSEPLNVMLNGDENGPIWTGNIAGNIDYDFTDSKYDESDTAEKTIIYTFFLDSCSNCKNFYKFIASDLLPNYADQFVVKSFPLPTGFGLLNQLAEHYGAAPENGNYKTPVVIVGKTYSAGGVDKARQDEIKNILASGGSTYDAVERINNGYATPDATTQTELSARDITMKCGTPIDSEYKLQVTEIDRSSVKLDGYDYITANDISAYRYGQYQLISGNQLQITIPVNQEYKKYKVAYLENGRIAETFDAVYQDGKVTFTTSHLSEYVIYGANNEPTPTISATEEAKPAAKLPANPETLDPIALYGIILTISGSVLTGSIFAYRKFSRK